MLNHTQTNKKEMKK